MPTLAFKTLVLIIAFVTYQPGDLGESSLSSSFLTCKSVVVMPVLWERGDWNDSRRK